jgi:hypothetical protein
MMEHLGHQYNPVNTARDFLEVLVLKQQVSFGGYQTPGLHVSNQKNMMELVGQILEL